MKLLLMNAIYIKVEIISSINMKACKKYVCFRAQISFNFKKNIMSMSG